MSSSAALTQCQVAVIWIDWYPYHVARFRGLLSAPALADRTVGIELVGGIGVHAGLKFREDLPASLPIETLEPQKSWSETNKLALAFKLWRRLSQLDPEVVLVPGYYTLPGIAAAIWARTHGAASVLMTESTAGDHPRIGWKERIKSLGMRALFDAAVTGGKAHVEYLRQLGFPEDRIAGFYDVVENQMFADGVMALRSKSSCGENSQQKYFLYVGRLAEEKNVAGLLRSWIAYRDAGGTWPLVLVGAGPEASALQAIASACPYSKDVRFAGLKSSHELIPFYADAGCFVLPSTREPWGLVVNEAMACGLPVLVSNRCGCAEDLVAPGTNGFTFDPTDSVALAALLSRISALSFSEHVRMGEASLKIVRVFSPENFGRSIASISEARNPTARLHAITGGAK